MIVSIALRDWVAVVGMVNAEIGPVTNMNMIQDVEGSKCSDITNDQLSISEETVFLRQESPCLWTHVTPSSGGSDNLGQACHTTLLPH